jgi:CMP/dCMP kinase
MTFNEALEQLKQTSPLRITVSGDIGSGKSTFAKHLAEELEIPRIYIGQFMREEALKRGITLEEFGKLQEEDDSIDREMDAMQKDASKKTDRGVFEGRTAWHFVEQPTVRIFLSVDPEIGAQRVFSDKKNSLRDKYNSLEEVKKRNTSRKASEKKRYWNYYQIDAYDHKNFDVVVDTSDIDIDNVFKETIIAIASFLPS